VNWAEAVSRHLAGLGFKKARYCGLTSKTFPFVPGLGRLDRHVRYHDRDTGRAAVVWYKKVDGTAYFMVEPLER